jgi:uncharacterized membrane protein
VTFAEIMHVVALVFEVVVSIELVVGLVWSFVLSAVVWRRTHDGAATYHAFRRCFGGVLLLGLELLVAADLVRTVAVQPTLGELTALGLIVLIRTFLSFALEVEINGVPPWRRWQVGGAQRIGEAHEDLLGTRTGAAASPAGAPQEDGGSGAARARGGSGSGPGARSPDTLVPDTLVPAPRSPGSTSGSTGSGSTLPDSLSSDSPPPG